MTDPVEEFEAYLEHLAQGLGHADRHAGLKGYCAGLVMPLTRKSIEPMAAHLDPLHASARHQSLHHFVAKAQWSDAAVMQRVRDPGWRQNRLRQQRVPPRSLRLSGAVAA